MRKEGHQHRPPTLDNDSAHLREYCRVHFRLVEKCSDVRRHLPRDPYVLCPSLSAEFTDIGTPMALAVLKAFAQVNRCFTANVEEIEGALRPSYHASEGRHRKTVALARHFEDRRAPVALEEPPLWEVKALVH